MLVNHEGQHVPQATFRIVNRGEWVDRSSAALFDHKTIVAFSVPGAFTCPHSPIQLLGYNEYAKALQASGVDEIFCIAVNDPFTLTAWAQDEGADQVRFLPDTRGDFSRQMGMLVNLSDKGMGYRSWRYSMLVDNGIIKKMFIEPDGFESMPTVSDAETMLNYVNPDAQKPNQAAVLMQVWRTVMSA